MEQRKPEDPKIMATFSYCFKVNYVLSIIYNIVLFPMTCGLARVWKISDEALLLCAINSTIFWLISLKFIFKHMEEKLVISDTQVQYFSGGWVKYSKSIPISEIKSCENSMVFWQTILGTSTLKIYDAEGECICFDCILGGEKAERIINDMLK